MSQSPKECCGVNDCPAKSERRRYQRYRCELPVELRSPNVSFPSQGKTIDLCLGGCYVASPFTIALGTELELKLWVGDHALHTKGMVRTSDPGVGNGIEFMNVDERSKQVLKDFFASLESNPEPLPVNDPLRDVLIR
jgi:hypothetical protein